MAVRVQSEDFDLSMETRQLVQGRQDIGALVTFTGLVRQNDLRSLTALELEHYPAMTQKALLQIEQDAVARWSLNASLIIHRFGRLHPGEQIMMVATAAPHRGDAFEAADFLMDYLKSRAPFWKKEHTGQGADWVDARETDEQSLRRWDR